MTPSLQTILDALRRLLPFFTPNSGEEPRLQEGDPQLEARRLFASEKFGPIRL
jgi:hypothetical protein